MFGRPDCWVAVTVGRPANHCVCIARLAMLSAWCCCGPARLQPQSGMLCGGCLLSPQHLMWQPLGCSCPCSVHLRAFHLRQIWVTVPPRKEGFEGSPHTGLSLCRTYACLPFFPPGTCWVASQALHAPEISRGVLARATPRVSEHAMLMSSDHCAL